MKMIATVLAAGMLISGVAQATSSAAGQDQSQDQSQQDQQSSHKRAVPLLLGADAATTASTGGITAATVVGVSILVGAVALIAIGANRDGHHGSGTTGTH